MANAYPVDCRRIPLTDLENIMVRYPPRYQPFGRRVRTDTKNVLSCVVGLLEIYFKDRLVRCRYGISIFQYYIKRKIQPRPQWTIFVLFISLDGFKRPAERFGLCSKIRGKFFRRSAIQIRDGTIEKASEVVDERAVCGHVINGRYEMMKIICRDHATSRT